MCTFFPQVLFTVSTFALVLFLFVATGISGESKNVKISHAVTSAV
jgi:hypothetical protein